MKQSKALNNDLKLEHKKTTDVTTMGQNTDIDCHAQTNWDCNLHVAVFAYMPDNTNALS